MREVVGSSPAGVNFFSRFGHLFSTPFFALYCMCFCQLYTRDISNLIKNSQAVKKGAAPKKAMVKKDVKSKVAAKKWL